MLLYNSSTYYSSSSMYYLVERVLKGVLTVFGVHDELRESSWSAGIGEDRERLQLDRTIRDRNGWGSSVSGSSTSRSPIVTADNPLTPVKEIGIE